METDEQNLETKLKALQNSLPANKVLAEQPDKNATRLFISGLLLRLADIYGLNFQSTNALMMADWILENYKYESLNIVIETLKNPPPTKERVWRINPDTIREWMAGGLEKLAQRREIYIHNQKAEEAKGWTDERLDKLKKIIDESPGFSRGPGLTDQEIKEEGQTRPKEKPKPLIIPIDPRQEKVRLYVLKLGKWLYDVPKMWTIEGVQVPGDTEEEAQEIYINAVL